MILRNDQLQVSGWIQHGQKLCQKGSIFRLVQLAHAGGIRIGLLSNSLTKTRYSVWGAEPCPYGGPHGRTYWRETCRNSITLRATETTRIVLMPSPLWAFVAALAAAAITIMMMIIIGGKRDETKKNNNGNEAMRF